MTLQTLTGHPNVSLAYLRLPDGLDGGGSAATGYQSLHRLLVGEISSITTVDGSATYTLDQLSATIVDLVRQSGAVAIRTHDFTTSGGTDDHPAVAQLVHDSTAGYEGGHTIYGYDDYDVASLPANVTGTDLEAKRSAFCTYAESDSEIDSENCPPDAIDEWLQRQVITGSEVRDPTVPTPTWAPVYRWWSATARDWLSVADHVSQPSASQLASQGYTKNPTTQFYASMVGGSGLVAVYRWWHSGDRDWIDVVDGSIPDSRMTSYGYTSKTLSYYAYSASATGRVAVYRWWGAADRDWITLRQGEIADSTMTGWGYTGKTLLGYALTTMPQTDPTYLTLVKQVVNDYGTPAPATSWTLSAAGPTPLSGAGGVPRTAVTAGTYTLSETGTVAGYTNGTTFTCATATGTPVTVTDNTLTLATGQDVTCTITNTALAPTLTYLTLVKKVVNDYGTPAPATSWTLSAAGPTPLSGAGGVPRTAVTAGTYTLSETGTVAGYTNGTTFTCATATGTPVTVTDNTLTLATGQDVTCTITNTALAPTLTYLTLVKKVVNDYGTPAPATSWTLSAAGPTPLSGAGGVPRTAVTAGTYTLSETGTVAGYTNGTTFTCATATGTPVTVTDNTLTLATGQDVTCTITNTAVGSLVSPGSSAPSPVQRWWSSTARDWVTVPQHGSLPISSELSSYARTTTTQYYVSLIGTGDSDQVAVYRWWHPGDGDWIDVADGSIPDSRLVSYGYTDKTFQYFAWRSAATGRVAVYRWWSASDRDWITLRSGEIADSTLTAWGYTGKTLVAYAIQSRGSNTGYFTLGTPQSSVVRTSYAEDAYPHTMSVLDVNPARNPAINNGYRYLGYFGHNLCGGIYIARSNDLNATSWVEDPVAPRFPEDTPCRWAAAAIVEGNRIALVVNEVWDETITLQYSTDGLNGTKFGAPTTLVFESHASNGNPMLFQNPETGRYFLYWFRNAGDRYEIRAKSGTTIDGLVESGPADIGALVAYSDEVVAAPSVMYVSGLYYLAVETYESAVWRTRVLTSTSPTGPFYEIPGNPVYPSGAACVFQHVWGNELHSFYCRQNVPGDDDSWTLDHVRGNLLSPN